jgi:hypothetical protein
MSRCVAGHPGKPKFLRVSFVIIHRQGGDTPIRNTSVRDTSYRYVQELSFWQTSLGGHIVMAAHQAKKYKIECATSSEEENKVKSHYWDLCLCHMTFYSYGQYNSLASLHRPATLIMNSMKRPVICPSSLQN